MWAPRLLLLIEAGLVGLKLALIHNLESFPGVGVKERGGWSIFLSFVRENNGDMDVQWHP